jgi:hypothetical protein
LLSRHIYLILVGLILLLPMRAVWADADPVNVSVSVSGTQRDTVVTFLGFSSNGAFITFIDNGSVVGTTSANSVGSFSKTLTNQIPGTHSFSISVQDTEGRTTPDYGFIMNLQAHTETVISNILLPTTIDVQAGQRVRLFGSATPNTQITVFVHSNTVIESFDAGISGSWSHYISAPLEPGGHTAYGRISTQGGLLSINSNTVNFEVTCKVADLDCSGRVDLVDFSILMYYWGTSNVTGDINVDGIVDLTDFSIMMYYWEG